MGHRFQTNLMFFTTHFNEKTLNLFENDDPKSTSFMMKSIFCAYTSRLRLVDCGNIFQIRHGSAKEESVSTHFRTHFNEKSIKFV